MCSVHSLSTSTGKTYSTKQNSACDYLSRLQKKKKSEARSGKFYKPLPRLLQISFRLVRPRNSLPPVVVSAAIAIVIVPSIIVAAPSPVAIFTVIYSLSSIGLGDHAQLLADL